MNRFEHKHLHQRGAATLLVTVVLSSIMAVGAFTLTRTSGMEQRITGNDLRSREAHEAAQAGLNYALAWGRDNPITIPTDDNALNCSTGASDAGCPNLTAIAAAQTSSKEQYQYTLTITEVGTAYRLVSTATGVSDASITATVDTVFDGLSGLFNDPQNVPPPWVIAGCVITSPTGTPDIYLFSAANAAIVNGTDCSAYNQQGNVSTNSWVDSDGDNVMDSSEESASTSTAWNQGNFNCVGPECAWNEVFSVPLAVAKQQAITAGQVYNASIPCGAAAGSPSIYVITNSGPINIADISGSCSGNGVDNDTIGTPTAPIVLIIDASAGCPKFNGGITIYGIIYHETTTDCAANGWGGAKVNGSVMWEGNIEKPNANSQFIEIDYSTLGDLDDVFNFFNGIAAMPGTWKDF